jgi:hypothetical protein
MMHLKYLKKTWLICWLLAYVIPVWWSSGSTQ